MVEEVFFAGFGLMTMLFALASVVAWVWALYHILTSDIEGEKRLLWALVVLFGGFIGAILYYFIEYRD